jgi:uncharacterized protein (DUF1786 family)
MTTTKETSIQKATKSRIARLAKMISDEVASPLRTAHGCYTEPAVDYRTLERILRAASRNEAIENELASLVNNRTIDQY